MSYQRLGILNFDEFCQISMEGDIVLIETDASFEEVLNGEEATVKATVLEYLIYTILPEKHLIAYYSYSVEVPSDLNPDGDALLRFENEERQKLLEKLKKKIGSEKKYVTGVLLPPETQVSLDYATLATMIRVLRDAGALDDSFFDELPESEVKICPACNSELHANVKTCLVCGYIFES